MLKQNFSLSWCTSTGSLQSRDLLVKREEPARRLTLYIKAVLKRTAAYVIKNVLF